MYPFLVLFEPIRSGLQGRKEGEVADVKVGTVGRLEAYGHVHVVLVDPLVDLRRVVLTDVAGSVVHLDDHVVDAASLHDLKPTVSSQR